MSASGDLRALADGLDRAQTAALTAAQAEAGRIVAAVGARYSGGGGMRGKKRRGLTVAMARGQRVETTTGGATFLVQGTVPAWIWLTSGTRPHRIPRRHRGREARLYVVHPGMAGRGAWRTVVAELQARIPAIVAAEVRQAVGDG